MSKVRSTSSKAIAVLPGLIQRTARNPAVVTVHRLRTTIRRTETALRANSTGGEYRKLLKRIAEIRRAAGYVRDVDVHIAILQELDRHATTDGDFAKLRRRLKRRRAKREKELIATLEKLLDAGVLSRLKKAACFGGTSPTFDNAQALNSIAAEFLTHITPSPEEAELHKLRVVCKHLRYSAELAPESGQRELLIAELKKVQDAIGAWHDVFTLKIAAEKLLGTARPLISMLRTQCQANLNEAYRVMTKARSAVRCGPADLPREKMKESIPEAPPASMVAVA